MNKKTKNILIGVGVAGLLLFLWYKNKSKSSLPSSGSGNQLPGPEPGPELSYEQHTFGLIAEEIMQKGNDIGVDEELVKECKPIFGGWQWQKCFDKFGKGKSIENLMQALEIIDKDDPSKDEIIKFNKIMLAE